jgi:hypothetical protein
MCCQLDQSMKGVDGQDKKASEKAGPPVVNISHALVAFLGYCLEEFWMMKWPAGWQSNRAIAV